jgi:uncharacterized protein YkvS
MHTCHVCKKVFEQKNNLNGHVRKVHDGARQYTDLSWVDYDTDDLSLIEKTVQPPKEVRYDF